MMIAETGPGTFFDRSLGGAGCLAMWQCTHSIGSEAVNGRLPVMGHDPDTPRQNKLFVFPQRLNHAG